MKIRQNVMCFFVAVIYLLALFSPVKAAVSTTLSLNATSGDTVSASITGDANSNIQLSYLLPGASSVTTVVFGATNGSGNFSTSISSGGYGIPAGSPVYATINNSQSSMILWPSYASSLSFSESSVQVAVGQSKIVSASSPLTLISNSASGSIGTSINGSQITISGLTVGSGTLTLCSSNAGCGSISVGVGTQSGGGQVSFDQNNVVLYVGDAKSVTISGGSNNGHILKSNSNTSVLHTNLIRSAGIIWLYGDVSGTATLTICSAELDTNCADLKVTVLSKAATALSFSQNDIILTPGLKQNTTISGGPDSNYYILSNSNSGVSAVTISGNIITVTGGNTVASNVITVCSTSVNNTCGNLNTTLANTSAAAASATVLSFSQNVVSIAKEDTASVTVAGGDGTGYSVSSNSAPAIATATVNGTGNTVSLYGSNVGSTIITICSSSAGTICASLYVTVTAAIPPIALNRNNISLSSGESSLVTISGAGADSSIYSNSNPDAVSANIISGGSVIMVKGGTVSGSATIVVCPSKSHSSKCVNLYASNIKNNVQPVAVYSNTPTGGDLIKASTPAIYYLGSNGKRYVFPNEKTYKTWYSDFSGVKTITDAQLASYPIGGNVTYKPGTKMVKVTTDPDVYAVDAKGLLRLITSEAVAKAIYGINWSKLVEDIPDAFFVNYSMGSPIQSAGEFNPTAIKTSAASINSDKGL